MNELDLYMPIAIAQVINKTQNQEWAQELANLYYMINGISEYVQYYRYGMILLIYHRRTP